MLFSIQGNVFAQQLTILPINVPIWTQMATPRITFGALWFKYFLLFGL